MAKLNNVCKMAPEKPKITKMIQNDISQVKLPKNVTLVAKKASRNFLKEAKNDVTDIFNDAKLDVQSSF